MTLFNKTYTSQWLVVELMAQVVKRSVSWKVWCKIVVFLIDRFTLAAWWSFIMLCMLLMSNMWHLWQVDECDSCDCTLFKVVINIVSDVQYLTVMLYWQNFQQMLRYRLRGTCIVCEEVGKRFCNSKANFPPLKSVTVCTCPVYPGFLYISECILIIWELPDMRFCSTALYPLVRMSLRVAALLFLKHSIPRLVQLMLCLKMINFLIS